METLISSLISLPMEFFELSMRPFDGGALTLIPAVGVICLAIGLIAGAISRRAELIAFLLIPACCQIFIVVADSMNGELSTDMSGPIVWSFALSQFFIAYRLVERMRAKFAATFLAWFSVAYSIITAFIAGMTFSGTVI